MLAAKELISTLQNFLGLRGFTCIRETEPNSRRHWHLSTKTARRFHNAETKQNTRHFMLDVFHTTQGQQSLQTIPEIMY